MFEQFVGDARREKGGTAALRADVQLRDLRVRDRLAALPATQDAALEGRRAIVNRLMTGAMYLAFLIAVIPLALVIWYTVGKGLTRFSYSFLTHSMAGVGPNDINGGRLSPPSRAANPPATPVT